MREGVESRYRQWFRMNIPTDVQRALLTDPQTSGGLLVACTPECEAAVLEVFRRHGFAHATSVGRVTAKQPGAALVVR